MSPAPSPSLRGHPTAFALLSGVLLVLCFPAPQLTLLAFVALAPLLLVTLQRRARARLFLFGYLAGVVFLLGSCYWLYDVMRAFGHLSPPAAVLLLCLAALAFALPFGLFSLAVGELARRWQLAALALAPLLWVTMEWLRTYLPFGGFPWNLLGYAVAPHIGWVQTAAYAGIYGLSFLIAAVNVLVAACWLAPSARRRLALILVALVLAASWFWGTRLPAEPATATALLVQTNLPQQDEFDPLWVHHHPKELEELEQLTRAAVRQLPQPPALVVWPEVPVSFYLHHDPVIRARLVALAQSLRSYLLVGIIDYQFDDAGRRRFYNSAALLSPAGEFVAQYDKIHLVPFGEYLPFGRSFGFLERYVREVSDFSPGREHAVLPAREGRLGVIICYEAIFPALVREFVGRGADVVVNISNDGWFGRSAAAHQHLNMARVRAVENRRFLVRATNTGVTVVVDPYGRVVARAPAHQRTVLVAGYAPRQASSLYARFGDWLPLFCLLVTAAALGRKFWIDLTEGTEDAQPRGTGKRV